jgi:hypothetical protein
MALCPAHADRNPSLSVRELADERVLVRCFAECPTSEVLSAVGLGFSDLFPERSAEHVARARRLRHATDLMVSLEHELTVAYLALTDVAEGRSHTSADRERVRIAKDRIASLIEELRRAST